MSYFQPSRFRGEECRREMENSLWRSVSSLLARKEIDDRYEAVPIEGPTTALDFGAYFDLTLELPDIPGIGERQRARAFAYLDRRFVEVSNADLDPAASVRSAGLPRITNLSNEWYSEDELDRLKRWWDIEPDNALALTASSAEELADAREWVPFALSKLSECAPDLHDEIVAIVREVVIARPNGSQRLDYGAASSFALWGALAVNAAAHDSWPRYYRTLVHEAAHLVLFGMAREQPLVEGGPGHRHSSPLRDDLRPLDGIFHAAFVSARESLAFDRLLDRHDEEATLCPAEEDEVLDLLEASAMAFWECADRVRESGKVALLGNAILTDCENYMRSNFEIRPA